MNTGGAMLSSEEKNDHLVLERLKGKRERDVFGKVLIVGGVPP